MTNHTIRDATVDDAGTIFQFICDLAEFEKARHEVETTVEGIVDSVFGENSVCDALIYELNGEPVAFALWYYTYSTWQGRAGIYLEDLYVKPEARGAGIGSRILRHLANMTIEKGYGRFEWSVLDWNTPAIRSYDATGAKPQGEWIRYRLSGDELASFAGV